MKKVAFIIFLMVLFACQKQVDYQPQINILNSNISALQKSRDSLAAALAQTNNNVTSLSKSLDSIKVQLTSIGTQIATLNSQMATANGNITTLTAQIAALNQQYIDLLAKYNAIILQLAASTLNSGLVAYYPFNGNANDSSGNGNNGTVSGATLSTDKSGNINKAYAFNGSDSYINFGNLEYINTGIKNEFSISIWLYVMQLNNSATGDQAMIIGDEISQNNGTLIQLHKTYGIGSYTSGAGVGVGYCNCLPNINQWVQYVIVQNTTGQFLYVNGVLWGKLTSSSNSEVSNSLRIGLFTGSGISGAALRPFNGKMDEIRIYNRAINQSEITYLSSF